MIGLWLLVDMVHPSCLHKHILDPAIVAHLNPSLRVIRLKHPVSGELFAHAIHQPLSGKRFAAGDAAKYLIFTQHPRCPPDLRVVDKTRSTGDDLLRTGRFAQPALNTIPFRKIKLRQFSAIGQRG